MKDYMRGMQVQSQRLKQIQTESHSTTRQHLLDFRKLYSQFANEIRPVRHQLLSLENLLTQARTESSKQTEHQIRFRKHPSPEREEQGRQALSASREVEYSKQMQNDQNSNQLSKSLIIQDSRYQELPRPAPIVCIPEQEEQAHQQISHQALPQYQSEPKYPTQRNQNSISLFSKPIHQLRGEEQLLREQGQSRLKEGFSCIKYAENGYKPHEKHIYLDGQLLVWAQPGSENKEKHMNFRDIVEVEEGRDSRGFKKHETQEERVQKWGRSLVIKGRERVVQLQMGSSAEKEELMECLRRIRVDQQ